MARTLTDTFAGIRPGSVPRSSLAQVAGGLVAVALARFLHPRLPDLADDVILPHGSDRPDRKEGHMPDPDALSPDDGIPIVLFLCVHNAGRSQMALGWFNHLAGDRAVAWSGGSEPGDEVNLAAVAAMAEVGIDIAREYPKPWTEEIVRAADVVVTMGCGDACPFFPGNRYEDWVLDDPHGQGVDAVRPIRDEIERRIRQLLGELGVTPR